MTGMEKTIAEGRGRFAYAAASAVPPGAGRHGLPGKKKPRIKCAVFLQIWSG
ncbi:hypothetical protein Y030_2298 [Burkholderia pseudomallei MSHR332]|nr:hypothetical protein Y030_2298 [Burkholderia pseudomallei MSHR332]